MYPKIQTYHEIHWLDRCPEIQNPLHPILLLLAVLSVCRTGKLKLNCRIPPLHATKGRPTPDGTSWGAQGACVLIPLGVYHLTMN